MKKPELILIPTPGVVASGKFTVAASWWIPGANARKRGRMQVVGAPGSLWRGVPIATLPMYGEQQLNAFAMVKELGLAIELRLDHKGHSVGGHPVPAEEIERALDRLMGGSGAAMRKKVKEMREAARNAVKEEGGSSYDSVGRLIPDFIKNTE